MGVPAQMANVPAWRHNNSTRKHQLDLTGRKVDRHQRGIVVTGPLAERDQATRRADAAIVTENVGIGVERLHQGDRAVDVRAWGRSRGMCLATGT